MTSSHRRRSNQGPLPPRCHLCRAEEDIVPDAYHPELWRCLDIPACNYRARLRIHMREAEAERLLQQEREAERAQGEGAE